jgi:ceramide glucosyltransferase
VISTAIPRTAGDVGYALMLNGLYEPAALATGRRFGGELPFIMGHIMILKRDAIAAIGGLECAEGQLVDDMYLGRRLHQLGYRNKMSPKPAAIIQQDLGVVEFVQILVRWVAFSISGLPLITTKLPHLLTGIAFWIGLVVGIGGAMRGDVYLAALGLLLPLSATLTINDLHYRMSGSPMPVRYRCGAAVLWLTAPLLYARIWTKREINWRGRPYRIDASARLRAPST